MRITPVPYNQCTPATAVAVGDIRTRLLCQGMVSKPPGYASVYTLLYPCARRIRCSPVVPSYLCAETTHLAIPSYLGACRYHKLLVFLPTSLSTASSRSRRVCVPEHTWHGDKTPFRLEVPKGTVGSVFVAGYMHTRVSCGAPGVLCPWRMVHG